MVITSSRSTEYQQQKALSTIAVTELFLEVSILTFASILYNLPSLAMRALS